jgi:UDP-N-acetylmuramoylalanine--D-glutamate ligase
MLPIDHCKRDFENKKILIFGLGVLGGAAKDAAFFASIGATVRATDQKSEEELSTTLTFLKPYPITFSLGGHSKADIDWADCIMRNPGVPVDHPLLLEARAQKKPIYMRSSLFARYANCPIIGVTGTRGKTTTTAMIHHLLSAQTDKQCLLGGNINNISDLELLTKITNPDNTIAILELSSWQLQGFQESKISPHIAVATNLYPDHLNRYASLETYYQDKRAIIKHQTASDYFVANQSQPEFHDWIKNYPGTVKWFSKDQLPKEFILKNNASHNQANAAAALTVASIYNPDLHTSTKLLSQFAGVPFRQQIIRTHQEITWVNDTTATSPDATIAAISAFASPSIFIIGGADKNLPLESLAEAINQHLDRVILFSGTGTDQLQPLIEAQKILGIATSMDQAVKLAATNAHKGDTVVLSPGFASFGLFINEFDRGTQFNQCVQNLPL